MTTEALTAIEAAKVAETLREYTEIDAAEGANLEVVRAALASCDTIDALIAALDPAVDKVETPAQSTPAPVGWQWNNTGTWHTVDDAVQHKEAYARQNAGATGRVRAIYEHPSPSTHVRSWTQEDAERENAAFTAWFKECGYPNHPGVYTLTAENAMHSAWQEAAKRTALATTEGQP